MIHYFGGPISPVEAAHKVWKARHGLVSFARPDQIKLIASVCSSWIIDNGAYTAWKQGHEIKDWEQSGFYEFCNKNNLPNLDFVLIPDTITGTERDNDLLCMEWEARMKHIPGVPVWHMHESLQRLSSLANYYTKVAIGSSGDFAQLKTKKWWARITEAVRSISNDEGVPKVRLHGLRMMDPEITQRIPFASVDSSTVARNINLDVHWEGKNSPKSKITRALVLVDRFEHYNGCFQLQEDKLEPVGYEDAEAA